MNSFAYIYILDCDKLCAAVVTLNFVLIDAQTSLDSCYYAADEFSQLIKQCFANVCLSN